MVIILWLAIVSRRVNVSQRFKWGIELVGPGPFQQVPNTYQSCQLSESVEHLLHKYMALKVKPYL